MRKNRGALKVTKLGGELPTEIAKNICPTCGQEIADSLLPNDIEQTPMRLDENISFLDSQEKMLAVYIEGQQKVITEKRNRLNEFQNFMLSIRKEIRDIKKELIQDERLPSAIEIEKRVILKQQIELLNDAQSKFSYFIEEFKNLSKKYSEILADESNLPKEFLSQNDKRKLSSLEENFISLLKTFDYNSKPFEAIQISRYDYLPVAQKLVGENLFYNIKFDSSATDFIRCIWAYATALLQTSIRFETNHPKLLMFDEPKQHDMSMINFRSFLSELSKFEGQQVLVFASFENSDISFEEATTGLHFNLNKIEEKLIKPINK